MHYLIVDGWERELEMDEIFDWCEYQFGERPNHRWDLEYAERRYDFRFSFKYAEDVALFKLRWL